ncbi:MAG TPA: hypothetical protein VGL22_07080 [Terracidiphilus sp.]|jgi:hypothetical protein
MFQIVQAEPAAIAVRAASWMDLPELAQRLAAAIVECGGWMLSASTDATELSILFEFECDASLEMYVALVSCGLSINKRGHIDLTRLWQCARSQKESPCLHIGRIALTVFASGAEQLRAACAAR